MTRFKRVIYLITSNMYLVLILLVSALLRFIGIYPGYNPYHPDEPAIYASAIKMAEELTYDPGRYDYPALTMIINAFFYKLLFIPISWIGYLFTHVTDLMDGTINVPPTQAQMSQIFNLYIVGPGNVNVIFWGRYITAFFALGDVLLIFLLGKKLFNRQIGLIAAFLLTFNFKHVVNSHLVLPDIYNAFFLLLSILVTLKLFDKQSFKNYALAGIAAGVSYSVKYQIYAVFVLIVAHLFISLPNIEILINPKDRLNHLIEFTKRFLKNLFRLEIFISGLFILITFVVLNPFYLIHFEYVRTKHFIDLQERYRFGVDTLNLYPLWYMYHFDYGPAQMVLFSVGLVWTLLKFFQKAALLFIPIALFLFVFCFYSIGGFFVRNAITITPLVLIFAAFATWQIYLAVKKFLSRQMANLLFILFLLMIIYIPAKNSFIASYYYTKPWNYVIMSDWLKVNLPQDAIVASDPWDLLLYGPEMKRTEFGVQKSYSLAEHQENGANWALISSLWSAGHFYGWMMFGPDKLSDYWNKPMDMLRNNYYGIATEEFFHYQVFAATKPWQASEPNLIIAKLPVWPKVQMHKIKNFTFNENTDNWNVIVKDLKSSPDYIHDADVGHSQQGSIRYIPGGTYYSVTRIVSPAIQVKPGYLYNILANIKTDQNLTSLEREGYIRIDFYGQNPKSEERGILTRVSARVYGTTDWVEKSITERAPEMTEYLTISFSNSQHAKSIMWLDDVKVEESTEPVDDITNKPPYNKRKIELDPFYPNSHGNL